MTAQAWISSCRLSRGARYAAEAVVWAAWWPAAPAGAPWTSPQALGHAATPAAALDAATAAVRAALGIDVEVHRVHPSFAAAARREWKGQPPAYCAPRPRRRLTREEREQSEREFAEWCDGPGAFWRAYAEAADAEFRRGEGTSTDVAAAFELLGLDVGAPMDAIKGAFRRRVLADHPDRGGDAAAFRATKEAFDLAVAHAERGAA